MTAERSEGRPPTGRSRLVAPVTAVLFGATAWDFGWTWSLPAYLALAAFLVVLTLIDVDTRTLPRRMVWAAGATGVGLLAGASVAAGEPERIVLGHHRGDGRVRAPVPRCTSSPGEGSGSATSGSARSSAGTSGGRACRW